MTAFGHSVANAVAIQANGKIAAAGWSYPEFAVARYTRRGRLDADFGTRGKLVTDFRGKGEDRANAALQGWRSLHGGRALTQLFDLP